MPRDSGIREEGHFAQITGIVCAADPNTVDANEHFARARRGRFGNFNPLKKLRAFKLNGFHKSFAIDRLRAMDRCAAECAAIGHPGASFAAPARLEMEWRGIGRQGRERPSESGVAARPTRGRGGSWRSSEGACDERRKDAKKRSGLNKIRVSRLAEVWPSIEQRNKDSLFLIYS